MSLHASRAWVVAWAIALTHSLAGFDLAGAQPEDDRERAKELFEQCLEAKKANDLETACSRCQESYELSGSTGPLVNLADCEESRGHLVVALGHWKTALGVLAADDPRYEIARTHIAALDTRVARLRITWSTEPGHPGDTPDPEEIRIGIDGAPAPGKPEIVLLDPGTHNIAVLAPDHVPARHRLTVAEGTVHTLVATPGPARKPAATPDPPKQGADGRHGQIVAAYALGGLGLVSLIGFAITGGLTLDRQSTVDDLCDEETRLCTDPRGVEAAEEGKQLEIANVVFLALAGAALATATILVLTAPDAEVSIACGAAQCAVSGAF